jgi:predicted Zn-dependent peptidase
MIMLKPIVLKNGLTILRIPKNNSNTFLTGFICRTGSAIEEGYFSQGISQFIEKLFWYGTDKHPSKRSLNLTLENLGGEFSSLTSTELTQFYISVPSYNQYKATSMLAELVQRSYFDSQDIINQKKEISANLPFFNEDLEMEPSFLATLNLYGNSSYGLPVSGTIDTISAINQAEILEYLSHQYRPDRSYLILAGNFDNKAILELVEREWSIWNPRTKKFLEPMEIHPEEIGELPRIIYRQKGLAQTTVVLGFLLEEGIKPKEIWDYEKDPNEDKTIDTEATSQRYLHDLAAILVLNTILGQGLSSRLWTKTVEEEMLFTKIQSEIVRFRSTGFLQIAGMIENSQFSFGLESIFAVLEALRKTTVSINEIAKAKEFLKGRLIMNQENLLESTIWQTENFILSDLNFELKDLLNNIDKIETAEIRTIASDLFVPEKLSITTLGTAKETRLVDKLIRKYLINLKISS